MAEILNVERAEKWRESIDRVIATATALKANVKAFETGGRGADTMLNVIELNRDALRESMAEENAHWKKMLEPPAQQEMKMDTPEQQGPRAIAPPPPKQLGPASGGA